MSQGIKEGKQLWTFLPTIEQMKYPFKSSIYRTLKLNQAFITTRRLTKLIQLLFTLRHKLWMEQKLSSPVTVIYSLITKAINQFRYDLSKRVSLVVWANAFILACHQIRLEGPGRAHLWPRCIHIQIAYIGRPRVSEFSRCGHEHRYVSVYIFIITSKLNNHQHHLLQSLQPRHFINHRNVNNPQSSSSVHTKKNNHLRQTNLLPKKPTYVQTKLPF